MLVDKLGSSIMLLVFSSLICIGQTVFALGMNSRDFNTMMIGRGLFGLGGESLEVAQASITTDWFQDHGLAFALGCNISTTSLIT
jgi:MFS family permease